MKIREANKFDINYILDMLRDFRNETPIDLMRECDNEDYVNSIFNHILLGGGILYIAEKDEPIGMIAGIKNQSIWDPELKFLQELVFWVEPEHRNSSAGYRLIQAYNKKAQELVDEDKIKMYTITKMATSPDLNFERFGYRKSEEVWVGGI
jgi:hypothetical protein